MVQPAGKPNQVWSREPSWYSLQGNYIMCGRHPHNTAYNEIYILQCVWVKHPLGTNYSIWTLILQPKKKSILVIVCGVGGGGVPWYSLLENLFCCVCGGGGGTLTFQSTRKPFLGCVWGWGGRTLTFQSTRKPILECGGEG